MCALLLAGTGRLACAHWDGACALLLAGTRYSHMTVHNTTTLVVRRKRAVNKPECVGGS